MKICWEILDVLRLTKPYYGPRKYKTREKYLISDWGIEINGKIRYIETQWEYIDHCWYCGSDFLKPVTMRNHYCDVECRHLHVIWKKDWERLRKQRYQLIRNPRPKPKEKPTIGIIGQPLGLKKGTPEWYEMKSLINKKNGKTRAAPFADIVGKARYETYNHKISWFTEEFRRDPKDHRLLQIKCFFCKKWFTPKSKQVSRMIHWYNTGKGRGRDNKISFTVLYCSSKCGYACAQYINRIIKKHKYKTGQISYSKYHKIPNHILYYDWQNDLRKLQKELRIVLQKNKKIEQKERESKLKLWKGKKWLIKERRENPDGIYRCNSCGRFMPKNMFARITTDNITGRCKKCQSIYSWIYCEDNREKMRENTKQWSKNNLEKRREYKRKQRRKNPRIRIRKKSAKDPTANKKDIRLIYKYSRMKTKTIGILHEVDHIIPLSKGGKHHENNLQVLTHLQNNKKSDKLNTKIIGIKLNEIKEYYNMT